ncbi:GNAT family N-acetyltransferase [Alginatibacterium sediminis]|uniref:GNAT family N-acetyltransferase n=1 Tax=Alginatibacterium sediminis TaxID=2164068 RepID=A0A420E7X3_9ALTE|nr:GNAT family N-acetyltransferase [Alginatibacterium sediminis]RKF14273.1 GNAT family N-acetyltransferase [Alginatibacterium sediminis]
MRIRSFNASDSQALWQLKFDTIRNVNCAHYNQEQLKAWAPDDMDMSFWFTRISQMDPLILEHQNTILGFADLQADGYIDHFFCHKDYIGQGHGRLLMQEVLSQANKHKITRLYSQVSITAKPFFENFNFQQVKAQQVMVKGVTLDNFLMERQMEWR